MLQKILPNELYNLFKENINLTNLYEIRIRNNCPIVYNSNLGYCMLKNPIDRKSVYADKSLIDYIICKATDYSLYAYNNQIKQGFITIQGGIRIGIAGEIVLNEDGIIKTIKNFNSLVVRIPHEILNCSSNIINYIYQNGKILNTLIVAPPGGGKTTFIRDIARNISSFPKIFNCLIVDERFEISGSVAGRSMMDVGVFSDIITGSTKSYGFNEGIKTLKPDVILCDEIASSIDLQSIEYASNSGVSVIATAHSDNCKKLLNKDAFMQLFKRKVFDRYIELSTTNGVGTIDGVYDENLKLIMGR